MLSQGSPSAEQFLQATFLLLVFFFVLPQPPASSNTYALNEVMPEECTVYVSCVSWCVWLCSLIYWHIYTSILQSISCILHCQGYAEHSRCCQVSLCCWWSWASGTRFHVSSRMLQNLVSLDECRTHLGAEALTFPQPTNEHWGTWIDDCQPVQPPVSLCIWPFVLDQI